MPSVIRNGRNAGASVEVAAMTGLFEAARQLQAFCDRQGWRSCFIGGIAVQRWGEPRVTRDVDLTLLTGFGGEERIHRQAARRVPRSNRQCARVCAPAPRTSAQDSRRAGNRYISRCAAVRRKSGRPRIGLFLWPRSFDPNMLSRRSDRVETVRIAPLDIHDAESVAIRHNDDLDWNYIEEQLRPLAEIKDDPAIMKTLLRLRS